MVSYEDHEYVCGEGAWVCFECARALDASIIVGFPKNRYCDQCGKVSITYEIEERSKVDN